jgi:hypothetical protein
LPNHMEDFGLSFSLFFVLNISYLRKCCVVCTMCSPPPPLHTTPDILHLNDKILTMTSPAAQACSKRKTANCKCNYNECNYNYSNDSDSISSITQQPFRKDVVLELHLWFRFNMACNSGNACADFFY